MSVQSEITRIQNAVNSAIAAIEDKGVSVPSGAGVADLASYIAEIVTGSTGYKVLTGTKTPTEGATSLSISHSLGTTPQGAFLIIGSTYTLPTTTNEKRIMALYSGTSAGLGTNRASNYANYHMKVDTTVSRGSSTVTFSAKYSSTAVKFLPNAYYYVIWG